MIQVCQLAIQLGCVVDTIDFLLHHTSSFASTHFIMKVNLIKNGQIRRRRKTERRNNLIGPEVET